MPCNAFKCDITHQPVPFDACIDCASSGQAKRLGCHHSADILRGIQKAIRIPMEALSVTELLDCPRALWFKKKHPYQVKPSQAYWAFRGIMVHHMIEAGRLETDISERRMYAKVGGHPISGQPDLIRGDTIWDWKTTSKLPDEPYEHHIIQVSCYRYLASLQTPSIQVNQGAIVYLDMKQHKVIPVSLWPLKKTEEWMIEKLAERYAALEQDTPPLFENHFSSSNWKCGRTEQASYCEVRGACSQGQTLSDPPPRRRRVTGSSQ